MLPTLKKQTPYYPPLVSQWKLAYLYLTFHLNLITSIHFPSHFQHHCSYMKYSNVLCKHFVELSTGSRGRLESVPCEYVRRISCLNTNTSKYTELPKYYIPP